MSLLQVENSFENNTLRVVVRNCGKQVDKFAVCAAIS
jgi:hypothetical protein